MIEGLGEAIIQNSPRAIIAFVSCDLASEFIKSLPLQIKSGTWMCLPPGGTAVYLQTARVLLRDIDECDEDNFFDLDSDPEVMRYLTLGVPSSRAEVKAAIGRCMALREKHKGQFGVWAAIEKSTNQFMGWFLFRPGWKDADKVERIELGYRLKCVFWGKGYATEVSRALVDKGFNELGVNEIFAQALKTNLASQEVMKKAGLSFRREFMCPDYPDDDVWELEFALSREKFFGF